MTGRVWPLVAVAVAVVVCYSLLVHVLRHAHFIERLFEGRPRLEESVESVEPKVKEEESVVVPIFVGKFEGVGYHT